MERSHRGMRRITASGTTFYWRIRRHPAYRQALSERGLTVLIVGMVRGGQRLVVALPWPHPGNWAGLPAQAVTPAMIKACIRQALTGGWKPERPGSPYQLVIDSPAALWED
ncbi:MAG TPA: hypothetical protein VGE07_05995 [Herpetosiphonaceae bacterium]